MASLVDKKTDMVLSALKVTVQYHDMQRNAFNLQYVLLDELRKRICSRLHGSLPRVGNRYRCC